MPRGEADSLAAAWTDAVEAWAALLGCTVHSPSFEADEQHYLGPVELCVAELCAALASVAESGSAEETAVITDLCSRAAELLGDLQSEESMQDPPAVC